MMTTMFALVGTALGAVVAFLAGAVTSYLVLRANKNKKAAVDEFANKVSDRLK